MLDGWRLAMGTLSVLPTGAPAKVDRGVAGQAMVLAPLVGVVIGGITAAVVAGVHTVKPETPLLAAALGVVMLVVLSGALHLDGLADTADAFGSRRDRETKLRIMKQSDIGPFGVVAIMVVLLADVAALSACVQAGFGWQAVLVAVVLSRLTLPWSCRTGIPSARPDGLGAMVAATVRPVAAGLITLVFVALLLALVLLAPPATSSYWVAVSGSADPTAMVVPAAPGSSGPWRALVGTALAGLLAVALAVGSGRRAGSSLGGITGDTLGATVELAVPVALLALALVI